MNKKFLTLTAGFIALFSACGDNVVLQDPLPANIAVESTAKLTVLVKDAATGAPLDAAVTLLATGDAVTTGATGTAVFDSLRIGDYSLLIEKEGYAGKVLNTSITIANNSETSISQTIVIAGDKSETVDLPQLNAGLEGYLLYEDASGKKYPAANAPIRVQLNPSYANNDYLQKVYDIKADKNGKYTFTGLPAIGTAYQLWALEYTPAVSEGVTPVTYRPKLISSAPLLKANAKEYLASETVYGINDEVSLFTVLGYTNTVDSAQAVVFEFNDVIDVAKVGSNSIAFYTNTTGTARSGQVADIAWGADGKTLTLAPRGKWTDPILYIDLSFKSVGGRTLATTRYAINVVGNPVENFTFRVLPPPVGYKTTIDSTDAIVVKFSDAIDVERVAANWVEVRKNSFNSNEFIAAKITWGADSLKLEPVAGKWTSNVYVSLSGVRSIRAAASTIGQNLEIISLRLQDPSQAVPFVLLDTYKRAIDSTEAIDFVFSHKIDTTASGISRNSVQISVIIPPATYPQAYGEFKVTWIDDTVRIAPITKWTGNFTVNFSSLRPATGNTNNTISPSSQTITLKGNASGSIVFALVDTLTKDTIVDPTKPLVFEFTEAIDVAKFRPEMIRIYIDGSQISQGLTEVKFSVDGKTVTIEPAGEKWTGSDIRVYFAGTLPSSAAPSKTLGSGVYSKYFYLPTPNLSALQVAGFVNTDSLSQNLNSTSYGSNLRFRWTKLAGATGYRIYAKTSNGSKNFVQVWSGPGSDAGIGGDSLYTTASPGNYISDLGLNTTLYNYIFANANELEFVIQAHNGISQTLINAATPIKAFDRYAPTINVYGASKIDSAYSAYNVVSGIQSAVEAGTAYAGSTYNYDSNDEPYSDRIVFSEPMDTAAAVIPAEVAGLTRVKVKHWWDAEGRNLYLFITVAAGTPPTAPVNTFYSITGLKDKRGNAVQVRVPQNGRPTVTSEKLPAHYPYYKNSLDFRFEAN